MRLLIVSHMPHHLRDGKIVGWGPTVRELDRLATRFDIVRHIACLHPGAAPASALPYQASNIELVPVPPSGADGFIGKIDVLRRSPIYVRTILHELRSADMVHVRAPAHIALIAMVILSTQRHPIARWFKYAGNWQPDGHESPSYTFQRYWLGRGIARGIVTVNGHWPSQPRWVRTFFNPSLDDEMIQRARLGAQSKQLTTPLRMLYVGRVETAKGAGRAVEITARLNERGIVATLELIGDGEERPDFEQLAHERGVSSQVAFLGWQPPPIVEDAYRRSHILLLPTLASEGWPKVLSEGMAYGVVPVTSTVSSIPQYLRELATGVAVPADQPDRFVEAITAYVANPTLWRDESRRATESTRWFSFQHYLESVDTLLSDLGVSRTA